MRRRGLCVGARAGGRGRRRGARRAGRWRRGAPGQVRGGGPHFLLQKFILRKCAGQNLEGSFLALSMPIFAAKDSFCRIFKFCKIISTSFQRLRFFRIECCIVFFCNTNLLRAISSNFTGVGRFCNISSNVPASSEFLNISFRIF